MKKNEFHVLGVMSGTSLDGIDIAQLKFQFEKEWKYEIIYAETFPYPEKWKQSLSEAVFYDDAQLEELNNDYTAYLANLISGFIGKNKVRELDAVCSHGHTIKHEPQNGFSLQIGNLPRLASLINQTVVCDFRVQDVQMGGQGAPLVPIGDELLFSDYDFCLNLGGFANVSTRKNGRRIAYDICAVNTVLNHLAGKLGFDYDKDGKIARSGRLNQSIFEELQKLNFYNQKPPKSLGIEWVNEHIFPILSKTDDLPSA
ncbi:MAG TPA: anhydro-N-acetylmuramic acid kinase, partial [Salinimicrobium sp.]|nr:anhydro-N-acetylmuramic acid kinase [Salinimicrobium sp.]